MQRTRSQRVLYRLADPYLRFWFRFVSPHQSFLQLGKATTVWEAENAPKLDEFVARTTWEDVCKWSSSPVGERVLTDLRRKAEKLPLSESVQWVVASRSGFERALHERAQTENVLLLNPQDLYGPESEQPA